MVNKNLYTLLVCLLLAGCDLIDYHPYDVRISGETDVNAHNIEQIEAKCKGKTTIRFITMGDSQRWYDETEDFVKEVNKRDDIDFVIHGGDMSDFGLTKEFLWQRDIMNGLKVPYVVLIGNHDCLGTGAETYQAVFGPTNFSFIASMHAHPFADVFNDNVAKPFQYYITQYPGLQFCTAAHNHGFDDRILFDDDVHYIVSDCMKSRSYLVFTITPEKYEYELVEY